MNQIAHCLDRLNLGDNIKVKQRAEQYLENLSRTPNKLFDKGPNLKPVICIQLANESLKNYDWNIKLAAQLAGCLLSAYESALSIARQRLDLQPTVTFDSLLVSLGSSTMSTFVKELWTDFSRSYLEKLSGVKKINAQQELEQSCWKGAIIYTCAKAFGKGIDKDKLHTMCGCSTAELNKSIKVVKSTCEGKIASMKSTSRKRTVQEEKEEENTTNKERKGKKRKVAEDEQVTKKSIKPISGIVSMINYTDYRNTRSFADYIKWRNNLINELS